MHCPYGRNSALFPNSFGNDGLPAGWKKNLMNYSKFYEEESPSDITTRKQFLVVVLWPGLNMLEFTEYKPTPFC